MYIIICFLYMVFNYLESNNIYGVIFCFLIFNCNLINEMIWLFCCLYNNECIIIVKLKLMFNRDFWGGGFDKNFNCINF